MTGDLEETLAELREHGIHPLAAVEAERGGIVLDAKILLRTALRRSRVVVALCKTVVPQQGIGHPAAHARVTVALLGGGNRRVVTWRADEVIAIAPALAEAVRLLGHRG